MPVPDFDLRVVRSDSRLHIAPVGELDIATAPQLEEAISKATSEPVAELVLDLRELTFMDSTGLRTLAQANLKAEQAGTALSIWRGSRQIERVLEISGLGPLLPLADAPAN
ncbi:MAG: STAS domain-containing protein [Solirubrobacteraceae bacterium]|nr:STAS domain-containing protein [Solirubrobacteraceae bacterium]